jgi:mycothiol synthase
MPGLRIDLRTRLDESTLGEVLALIDATAEIEGHRPVGEHKYAHLKVGASGWVGVLAYEDDVLVGYAHTRWNRPGERPRLAVEVVVHPEADQPRIAERLLDETREVLARAGGGTLWLWVHRVEDPADTVAAKLGFDVQRELAFMTRRLQQPPEPGPPPDGVTVRPYRPGVDDAELLRVNNAAFAGHPENGGWDLPELERRRELGWFNPDGVLMAWRGDRLLGFHWTKWHGHDSDEVPAHEPVGEVYILAVHPEAQGLGLGRHLLRAGLRQLADCGCREAVLYVDQASQGAVRLYESEGFATASLEVCYQRRVPPVGERASPELLRPAFE